MGSNSRLPIVAGDRNTTDFTESSIVNPESFLEAFNQNTDAKERSTDIILFYFSQRIETHLHKAADRDPNPVFKGMRPDICRIEKGINNFHRLYLARKDRGINNFGYAEIGPGNSIAVLAREYYQSGFRKFFTIGSAGHTSIASPKLEIGDLIIPSEAFPYDSPSSQQNSRKEVSDYYDFVRRQRSLKPTDSLLSKIEESAKELGIKVKKRSVATTGDIYRETPSFAREILGRGADVIDMECAPLYSVLSGYKDAEVASILFIVDRFPADGPWSPVFNSNAIYRAERNAVRLFLDAIDKRPRNERIASNSPKLKRSGFSEVNDPKLPCGTYEEGGKTYYYTRYASSLINFSQRSLSELVRRGYFTDFIRFSNGEIYINRDEIEKFERRLRRSP